jgi:D-alanyl-D-alanine carboxypeptidase
VAIEIATAYVSLVPSARGIRTQTERELTRETVPAAAAAGDKAGRTFSQRFASGVSSAGKSIARAGDKLSLAVSAPLLLLGKKATDAASDLNESVNATNVVFGKSAGVIDQWAGRSAESFGLSSRAFRQAVTPMGAMLQNLGLSQRDAADWSVKLTGRASDMASVFNTDVSTALQAINAGLRGESDPLEQFGVGLNEAAVNAKAVELGLAGAGGEVSANAKAQARLALIMDQTNKIEGDFAATSGEVANQQRITAAEAENAAAQFGQKLLPIKQKLIKVASSLVDWFSGLSEGQQQMALKAGVVAVALGPVLSVFGRLAQGVSGIVKTTASLGKWALAAEGGGRKAAAAFVHASAEAGKAAARTVASIATQIARWTVLGAQALLHAAKVAAAWLISMGPIGLVIAAVAGAATLIVKHWDKIQRFVTGAAKATVDFLKRNWPLILAILTGPIGLAVLAITKHWDKIRGVFRAGWVFIRDFFVALPGRIKAFFVQAGTWLLEGGKAILRGLRAGIIWIYDHSLKIWFVELPSRIKDRFARAGEWLLEGGKNVLRGLWRGIRKVWQDVVDWFKDVPGKIRSALGIKSPPKWAVDIGFWIFKAIVKGMGFGVGKVMDFLSGLAGNFTGALRGAWDSVFEFFAGGIGGKGIGGGPISGLEDSFEAIVLRILGQGAGAVSVISGFRTRQQQEELYRRYLAGTGNLAARPGTSMHERGLAVDFGGVRSIYTRLAKAAGLIAPVSGEPWHWEPPNRGKTSKYHRGGIVRETGPIIAARGEGVFTADQMSVLGAAMHAAALDGIAPTRGGPAVEIDEVHLHDDVDVDVLSRRLEFLVAGGRL